MTLIIELHYSISEICHFDQSNYSFVRITKVVCIMGAQYESFVIAWRYTLNQKINICIFAIVLALKFKLYSYRHLYASYLGLI